ncbi:hypothetical protein BJ878DRAFT_512868 [Calycina marina]|uniref:Uncharacterized protein n=1 Tax=Calycina marina TaxID=1763456 RepID=A0A9P7Z028_9HELO|nr:hypothetical protein BJ878DRAFT_512868 [Calycina marina]
MPTLLGKRKRRAVASNNTEAEDLAAAQMAQEIFQRHFEAQFKPLAIPKIPESAPIEDDEDSKEEEELEWDGISEEEEGVKVVEHTDAYARMAAMSKQQLKAFMTSKPPTNKPSTPIIRDDVGGKIDADDVSEAANLKKDLALQRLISESHLLDSSSHTLSGKNRHKALDMRIQALGSKGSILRQEKMPMSHRKGIEAKKKSDEEKRRNEAKENGVILERATGTKTGKVKKELSRKRDRGVGAPGIGQFKGGTLKLSKRDIFEVEGPKRSAGKNGRGGRGGGRGGRGRGRG